VRLAVAAVVLVLVGGYAALRLTGGDDGTVRTADRPTASGTPAATSSSAAAAASSSPPAVSPSASASSTPAASPTKRPPTLAFTEKYPAYITVRVPGGVTLVSKLFKAGAKASYDKKVLQVVNGRPDAVRFVVNGKPRKPGPSGRTEVFTVRRT
jgi:cytoskeleton protein RodZ